MSADLTKLALYSNANAFKNDDMAYTGSITFPTSVAASTTAATTSSFTLGSSPQFTKFFANFQELTDAQLLGGAAQWYPANVAYGNVGIYTPTSPFAGWLGAYLYAVINGTTVTIRAEVHNPYSSTVTFNTLTVPFAFIEYTLAN